jgi:hypothetical protein
MMVLHQATYILRGINYLEDRIKKSKERKKSKGQVKK